MSYHKNSCQKRYLYTKLQYNLLQCTIFEMHNILLGFNIVLRSRCDNLIDCEVILQWWLHVAFEYNLLSILEAITTNFNVLHLINLFPDLPHSNPKLLYNAIMVTYFEKSSRNSTSRKPEKCAIQIHPLLSYQFVIVVIIYS